MVAAFTPLAGAIIFAPCLDPRGRNLKTRPLLVVADAVAGDPVRCVAISGEFGDPLPPTQVRLPHANPGVKCHTGLNKPCAVICTWLILIDAM